jgi:hypothetical protein
VAEFQRRGVVHFDTLWRLDAATDELAPPPARFDAQLLAHAIAAALPKATVPAEAENADPYGWGRRHEVRALELGDDSHEAARVAAYIAKYATKSPADAGGVGSRIEKESELGHLGCREHARRLVSGAWQVGALPEVDGNPDAAMGAPVRLRRALLHQEPAVLHHVQGPARSPRPIRVEPW